MTGSDGRTTSAGHPGTALAENRVADSLVLETLIFASDDDVSSTDCTGSGRRAAGRMRDPTGIPSERCSNCSNGSTSGGTAGPSSGVFMKMMCCQRGDPTPRQNLAALQLRHRARLDRSESGAPSAVFVTRTRGGLGRHGPPAYPRLCPGLRRARPFDYRNAGRHVDHFASHTDAGGRRERAWTWRPM